MRSRIFSSAKTIIIFAIPVLIYVLLLINAIPRQIGLAFRYDFTTLIPILFIALSTSFYLSGYKGKFFAFLVTLLIFALPLSGLWNIGNSERYLIGGVLPFSDAYHYYMDAKRLLIQQPFSDFTARRPLFSAMLSVILFLTNQNLQYSIAILVLITAVSCYLASREIQAELGTFPAVLFFILIFLFYRPLSGKTMTENLGLPLGLIGFSLLIKSARLNNLLYAYFGIFLTTVSLNARAGAFFVLPAYILWGIIAFRKKFFISYRFIFLSVFSVGLGFALNYLIFSNLTHGGMLFSNFSTTFYGLAVGGKSWTRIYTDYPKLSNLPEPQFTYKVYQYAFEEIRRNPGNFLYGLSTTYKMFFGTGEYSVYCYIGGDNNLVSSFSKYSLYIFCSIGFIFSVKNIKNNLYRLVTFSTIGLLVSIPFVPPIDASNMRAYAATIPLIVLLPSIGFYWLLNFGKVKWIQHKPVSEFNSFNGEFLLGSGILGLILLSLVLKNWIVPPAFEDINCQAGETALYFRNYNGSRINLIPNDSGAKDFLPEIRIKNFLNNVHDLPQFETFYDFDQLKENTTILYDLDLKTGVPYMIFIDDKLLPTSSQEVGICGKLTDNPTNIFRFFYASSARNINIQ